MSIGHGLTPGFAVYRLAPGVQYLVIVQAHCYDAQELLQTLGPAAVQVVIDENHESVFIWPENADHPPQALPRGPA